MLETTPEAAIGGYVSVELAAKVAGISRNDMQQLAVAFAKGREEPWLGAVLEVRTAKVLGRRQRDIRVSSLPVAMCDALDGNAFRFLLAAEQAEPGAEVGPQDFLLLHRAVQSGLCPEAVFVPMFAALLGGRPLVQVSRDRFDAVMDCYYGWGFRDPRLPGVSADYREFLDRSRRHLGMSDRYYAAVLAELACVDRPDWIDGGGFVRVANYLLQLGLPWGLPERDLMDRHSVGAVQEARYQLGIGQIDHEDNMVAISGGVIRTRYLDVPGFNRLQAWHMANGYIMRNPPPRVAGAPGYITQPQVNLIWRLWCDRGGDDRPEALDSWLGYAGGVATLTAAGAGRLIDDLLGPVIGARLAAAQARA